MLPLDHETKLVQGSGSREGHGPMQTSNRELCVCSLGRGGHHATFVGLFPPSLYLVLCALYPSAELWEENKKKVEMLMLNLSLAMLSHASYSCAGSSLIEGMGCESVKFYFFLVSVYFILFVARCVVNPLDVIPA